MRGLVAAAVAAAMGATGRLLGADTDSRAAV